MLLSLTVKQKIKIIGWLAPVALFKYLSNCPVPEPEKRTMRECVLCDAENVVPTTACSPPADQDTVELITRPPQRLFLRFRNSKHASDQAPVLCPTPTRRRRRRRCCCCWLLAASFRAHHSSVGLMYVRA